MISFKGAQFPKESSSSPSSSMSATPCRIGTSKKSWPNGECSVDHATLNRWVAKYSPLIASNARRRKAAAAIRSWRMDETYIKVKGEWIYLYRAVDKFGKTLDFMLSKRRNKAAATKSSPAH